MTSDEEQDDIDNMIREREREDSTKPDWRNKPSKDSFPSLSQDSDLQEILADEVHSKKKFGDYFREANLANPIGKIVRDSGGGTVLDELLGLELQSHVINQDGGLGDEGADDDDDDDLDISKVKEKYYKSIQAIEEGNFRPEVTAGRKEKTTNSDALKDRDTIGHTDTHPVDKNRAYDPYPSTKLKPFQPGSTPAYLGDHYMVWNRWGLVQSFQGTSGDDGEIDESIEIDYFDKSIHHAMRITNVSEFDMADMSRCAVILASFGDGSSIQKADDSDDDDELNDTTSVLGRVLMKVQKEKKPKIMVPSKLKCLHFSSWDSSKEWELTLPPKELIIAIALGSNWCALATNLRFIRTFSIGGVQRLTFMVPGDVICLTACDNELAIVYCESGESLLSLLLYDVPSNTTLLTGLRIPSIPSRSSTTKLTWIGYSERGRLYLSFSTGTVLTLLKNGQNSTWVPMANTKSNVKNKSDNYWITSIHEEPSQIRAILCKGSRFPLTLPRPTISILAFQLPLVEPELDSTKLESDFWITWLMAQNQPHKSYSAEEEADNTSQQANALIKLFALFCRSDKDFKAHEVCTMMPSIESAKMALKYASRVHKLGLAQRLTRLIEIDFEEADESKTLKYSNGFDFEQPSRRGLSNTFTRHTNAKSSINGSASHFGYRSESELGPDLNGSTTIEIEDTQREPRRFTLNETPSDLLTQSQRSSIPNNNTTSNLATKPSNPFKVATDLVKYKEPLSTFDEMEEEMQSADYNGLGPKKRKKKENTNKMAKSKVQNKKPDLYGVAIEEDGPEGEGEKMVKKEKGLQAFFKSLNGKRQDEEGLVRHEDTGHFGPTPKISDEKKPIATFKTWLSDNKGDLLTKLKLSLAEDGIDQELMDEKQLSEHLTKFAIQKYKILKSSIYRIV